MTDTSETRRETWARSQLIPYAAVTLADSGLDVASILRRYGIAWPLEAPEIELPMTQHHALLDELAALSKDDAFALHLGQRRRQGSHGLLEYFWRAAENVEKGLLEVVARGPLLDENSEFVFKRSPAGGGLFGQRVRAHRYGLGRHSNEFFVAAAIAEIEKLTGKAAAVRRIMFEHAPRAPGVDYEKILSCDRIEFDVGITGFELDDETLARGMKSADPGLLDTLRRHVKGQGAARPLALGERPAVSEEVSRITDALRSHVGGPLPTLTQLAEGIGLSARSLQRRLADEGLTLRALAERVRMQEAERRLRETREDVSSLATTLGFSSASNFARAFRRWAGTTPQAFRTEKKQS